MPRDRRQFLRQLTAVSLGTFSAFQDGCTLAQVAAQPPAKFPHDLIIDTHQHLWDLQKLNPPWLKNAPEILRRRYFPEEYAAAVAGFPMRALYMEVDVAPEDHFAEADFVKELCRLPKPQTLAATIGGRPNSPNFAKYLDRQMGTGIVKGVRQVLHAPETPAGFCLKSEFIRGIQTLGETGLHFDLCMRAPELADAATLVEKCPETRFVLDHCGNGDPKAFNPKLAPQAKPGHNVDQWKRDLTRLAKSPNVICKISGIVASSPRGGNAEDLAPIVNFCLDSFGPDRVVFGTDWPVCLLGASAKDWIQALLQIISTRPQGEQRKLLAENAIQFYGLKL